MNPQWNAVLTTSKTTPKRSLASGDRAIANFFSLPNEILCFVHNNKSVTNR